MNDYLAHRGTGDESLATAPERPTVEQLAADRASAILRASDAEARLVPDDDEPATVGAARLPLALGRGER